MLLRLYRRQNALPRIIVCYYYYVTLFLPSRKGRLVFPCILNLVKSVAVFKIQYLMFMVSECIANRNSCSKFSIRGSAFCLLALQRRSRYFLELVNHVRASVGFVAFVLSWRLYSMIIRS